MFNFFKRLWLSYQISRQMDLCLLQQILENEKCVENTRLLARSVFESENLFGHCQHDAASTLIYLDGEAQRRQYAEHGEKIVEEAKQSFTTSNQPTKQNKSKHPPTDDDGGAIQPWST